jgi:hypothetical protein
MHAGVLLIATAHQLPAATEVAIATRTAEKPYAHALPDLPTTDAGTKRIDTSHDLMAGDARPHQRELAFDRSRIGVAHTASFDPDPHLVGSRLTEWQSY